jgi:hypothetical protein
MQFCIMLGVFSAALALLSLLLGSRAMAVMPGEVQLILENAGSAAGRAFTAAVFLLILSGLTALFAMSQYAYYKRKYDNLRHSTQEHFGTQDVCDCYVATCTCEDDFIEDMDKNYHINLSY